MTAVLRHAGSADPDKPGSAYGNQQYAGGGVTRHCVTCDTWRPIRAGWKKVNAFGQMRCPACAQEKASAAG